MDAGQRHAGAETSRRNLRLRARKSQDLDPCHGRVGECPEGHRGAVGKWTRRGGRQI